MKNLYANDSEFYRFLYSTQVTGVACKTYMFVLSKRTLSSELGNQN